MFLNFIGINEKILNLSVVALIEDKSEDGKSIAVVTTSDGAEIELTGDDADLLFDRMELVSFASDSIFATLQQQFDAAGPKTANQYATDETDT